MTDRNTMQLNEYRPYLIVYVLGAIAFLLVKGLRPEFPFSFVIKAVPALSLGVAAIFATDLEVRERIALVLGALLCGAGDVILDIDRVRLFVPGLVAFLLGHVGFLVFFTFRFERRRERSVGALPVLVLAVGMAVILVPRLGSLLVPVIVYLLVITAMTLSAVFSRTHWVAALGAFIFMVSDALLASAKFVFAGIPSPMVTIPVYFIGLGTLGFGVLLLRSRPGNRKPRSDNFRKESQYAP